MADAVRLEDVQVRFGAHVVIANLSMHLAEGEFVTVVGPSGCGKSTLLNIVTGLLPASGGTVSIMGHRLTGLNLLSGYMLQQDALLPWKTALDNVALGLLFKGVGRAEARERAGLWLQKVGLGRSAHRYPHELSGGMRKRVGMAQTLIGNPRIVLMDEPFSALDVHTRHDMENELLRLWQEDRRSILFITHDLEEAIALSDRVVVMGAGPSSTAIGEFSIPIERPRDVGAITMDPRYQALYREIWTCLRGEVVKSHAA